MNSLLVSKAERILHQRDKWLQDRNDPPSLRDGWSYPGDEAIELAQLVIRCAADENDS